jgi:simple sugar transport system permease protein
MMDITILVASVLAASPPIIFAVLGETITEKAGVINLSLDGTILMTAMVAFIVALQTDSIVAGFWAASGVGAFIAFIIAFASLTLHQSQVATGFVLTLLCRDLAYVLGNPYAHVPGPQVPHTPLPGLSWGRSCSTRIPSSISACWGSSGHGFLSSRRSPG